MNNFLLESPGLFGTVEKEVQFFFLNNEGTESTAIAWDTFKAYIRVILVSYITYRDKALGKERVKRIKDIHKKEILNKRHVTPETTEQLKRVYEHLKIIDARKIAQNMLYSNQRMFDYGNKPDKQLTWVLSSRPLVKAVSTLWAPDGELVKDIMGKLEVFAMYY